MEQKIIYTLERERKELFEANKDFAAHMERILDEHLEVDFWTDADEDGLCGGVTISMDYTNEGEDTTPETITINRGKIEVLEWDEEMENSREILLTEDQLKIVRFLLKDAEEFKAEELSEAECYAKGPYHYNGVSMRDFL